MRTERGLYERYFPGVVLSFFSALQALMERQMKLAGLDDLETRTIKLAFGMGSKEPLSNEMLARELMLTVDQVRALLERVLTKLELPRPEAADADG